MLTLTRKAGERIVIGDGIEITVVDLGRGKVRIGITAPRGVPIHRGEVVERIGRENRAAAASRAPTLAPQAAPTRIDIPAGLFGLRGHRAFDLYDVDDHPELRQLVSVVDPLVSLCIIDAELISKGYPTAAARELAGSSADVVVALVVTLPRDGRPATVSMTAPLVIDVATRTAVQVILDEHPLPLAITLSAPRAA